MATPFPGFEGAALYILACLATAAVWEVVEIVRGRP